MGPEIVPFFFLFFIVFAIAVRLVAGSMDEDRVGEFLRERNCKLLEKKWTPFGPGWFGEKNARIYQVTYEDADGNIHEAYVKTSLFSGVYLTNDTIIERKQKRRIDPFEPIKQPHENIEHLKDENERLRRRIEELENERRWQ